LLSLFCASFSGFVNVIISLKWQQTFRCIDIATYHGWAFTGTAASPLICVPLTLVAALRSKHNIQLSTFNNKVPQLHLNSIQHSQHQQLESNSGKHWAPDMARHLPWALPICGSVQR
jgi:hypothetical protein